jgi:hypothetical protein
VAGGKSGFAAGLTLAGTCGFDAAADFAAAAVSASFLTERGFFRSGFTCLATFSQSARSSSLKLRLRCGGAGNSGIRGEAERFIFDDDKCGGEVGDGVRRLV